jgi:pantoate--beta-alanine ligase
MGYLHAGHLSLVKQARDRVGADGKVVVSIYVNPTQFSPSEDLAKYPRDLARDTELCANAGVDVLFVPTDAEMYPSGFSTYVVEEQLAHKMEGITRPHHFRGVTTVVSKLFNTVQPNVSVFGAKDYQQAAIIQQMVRDLNFPIEIIVAPTVRETDGLALSSRNKYLNPEQRKQALILSRAIQFARETIAKSPVAASQLREDIGRLIATASEARLDYVEFFDPRTLVLLDRVQPGAQMALAVYFGATRLIDNGRL